MQGKKREAYKLYSILTKKNIWIRPHGRVWKSLGMISRTTLISPTECKHH